MNRGDWVPTMDLRWSKEGKLQQKWFCEVIEYRMYGGKQRSCKGADFEWRDIPSETVTDQHGKS